MRIFIFKYDKITKWFGKIDFIERWMSHSMQYVSIVSKHVHQGI